MSVFRSGVMTTTMLKHYEGALVGALVGDCLGSPFEFSFSMNCSRIDSKITKITKFLKEVDEGKYVEGKNLHYTDDTAMLKSVTESLFHCNGFDATDLSKRFAKEYFARPDRGYGSNIPAVFREMKETKYKDPFGPASRQFNGSGSYGNGGAMRIAPAALFGLKFNDTEFNVLVENITRVTHSHSQGINGAILEASAVKIALQSADSVGSFSCSKMLTDLQKIMSTLETSNSEIRAADEKNLFCEKLKKIKEFVERSEPTVDEVVNVLGNDVSAIKSVPAAIYSFLRTVEKPAEGWEKPYNQFERTIIYSISLGGDTDTIASMAGAIAGAYCGIDNIPESWQMSCEGLDDAKLQAKNLYSVALKDS